VVVVLLPLSSSMYDGEVVDNTCGGGGGGGGGRGPAEKMSFFQIVHMTKVTTQIHSSISQYDA